MIVTPDACERVRRLVLAMPMAQTLQLCFERIDAGAVELRMPILDAWCFRPGQLQASALFAVADFAAVAAAATALPAGFVNATIDASLKLFAPAVGSHVLARGRVVHAARVITVCAADVYAVAEGVETLCATWLGSARNLEARVSS